MEPIPCVHFCTLVGTNRLFPRDICEVVDGDFTAMLDQAYFLRQIRILLKFARLTSDPLVAAGLMEKAVNLKSQVDGLAEPKDVSPLPPDVEPEK